MIYAYAALTVTDPANLASYSEKAGEALAKHGGQIVAATTATSMLDGNPNRPDAAALISFPDKEAALAWAHDPALEEVHALRRSAGASDILLLG